MQFRRADLADTDVVALLRLHVSRAEAETARGSAHALDVEAFRAPDIVLWTVWEGEALLGMGALRTLSAQHGEVKSMRTAKAARRRGVGAAMLRHLIAEAGAQGLTRLSLETGARPYFAPAHALYRRFGFRECPAFGRYVPDENSLFFTLDLQAT